MSHQRGVDPTAGSNADKAEPKHLHPDTPGPNPRPPDCVCTWTALSLGWTRGPKPSCTADH